MTSGPVQRVLDALEARGCKPRGNVERGWDARCAAHEDRSPSLKLDQGDDGKALVKCHRGCSVEEICAALGLKTSDLFPEDSSRNGQRHVVERYDYLDEHGELLYQVERFDPKGFRQRRPDGNGGWIYKLDETRRVLYKLPAVIAAVEAGEPIWIAEGEEDVHALERAGVTATCNPMGAGEGKWRPEFSEFLRGAVVWIVADQDKAGREHAEAIRAALTGIAASVRVVAPIVGSDARDHLDAGHKLDEFKPVEPERDGADVSSGLRVTGADLSRARPPRWAWQDRIVLGNLNLLLGNEGSGKGTLSAWLIARLTRGDLPGDLRSQPVAVGVLGDEDDFDSWWTPKLYAAGADLDLVKQIDRPDGGFVNVREDREKLARACEAHKLWMLFFDQLLDNLGVGTDDWRQKAIRDALQPLRSLARELEVAALGCLQGAGGGRPRVQRRKPIEPAVGLASRRPGHTRTHPRQGQPVAEA